MIDLAILIPFFNESDIIDSFLSSLNTELELTNLKILIVFVDDHSIDNTSSKITDFNFSENIECNILKHVSNSGNQMAIRSGLNFLEDIQFHRLLIMDSDGEDDPKAIKLLLETNTDIVVVKRGSRNEPFLFKILYLFYKIFTKLTISKTLDFGNFSLISKKVSSQLNHSKFVHYSSSLLKHSFSIIKITFDKAQRINNTNSKISNYQFYVYHGLYSLLEHSEIIFFKVIKILLFLISFLFSFLFYILFQKFFTTNTIPGWTSTMISASGISIVLIINTLIIGLLIMYMSKRNQIILYDQTK